MDATTTSSCAPAAAKDVPLPRRSLQEWHARSRRWAGRVQPKRIGRRIGCKLLWNPAVSRFEIRGGNSTATQSSKAALLCLDAKFHHGQALWTAKKAQRRADILAVRMPTECYETRMERYETHSSSLWHRHRRGKRKASNQLHRQQNMVDSTRRSTAPGGRRSKLLDFGAGRSTRRSCCKVKRSARGANSISRVYEQLVVCADQQRQELHEWQQEYQEWKEWQQCCGRKQRKRGKDQAREQHKQANAGAKQTDPVRAAVLEVQFTIKLDCATQQQWDLLAKSRRWGGLLQGLINLLRPRFAGAAMFALKQAFVLCDSGGIGTVIPAGGVGNVAISDVLVQLLAPTKPKRRSPTAVGLVAGEADLRPEQAARLRLGRAVELLFGDVAALTQAQMAYFQNQATRPEPRPEPLKAEPRPEPLKPEPERLEKLCHATEWPELVVSGAAVSDPAAA